MTKLLVLSDNHFQQKEFTSIVNAHDDIDYYIHCGDSQWQPDDENIRNFIIVRGNNDFVNFPDDKLLEIAGKRILITHGHLQHVYNHGDAQNLTGTEDLVTFAIKNYQADIVLYGHTHVPEMHIDRDVIVVNPGSTNFPRGFSLRVQSYAIITIEDDNVYVNFYNAKTQEDITSRVI